MKFRSEPDKSKILQDFYDKSREAYDRSNYDYAITLLKSVLFTNPDFHKARSLLRITQIKKVEGQKKKGSLQLMIFHLSQCHRYIRLFFYQYKAKWIEGIQTAEEILNSDAGNTLALQKLALFAGQLNWVQCAIDTLEVTKKMDPGSVKVTLELAQMYMKEGDLDKARRFFDEANRLSPANDVAARGLKDLAAIKTIEQGGWMDTSTYRDKIKDEAQAELFEKETKLVKSEADITLLIESTLEKLKGEPDNPAILKELVKLYDQGKFWDKAIEIYNQLTRVLPHDEEIQREIVDLNARKLNENIIQLKEKLSRDPSRQGLVSEIEQLEKQKTEKLLADCKARVDHYPNNLTYRYELGYLYYELEKFNEAVQEFQLAVKDPQKKHKALYYMGLCFKDLGFFDLSEKQLLKVLDEYLDMDGFKKEIFYNLGLVYEATGQKEKALNEYKKIFEVDISFRDVAQKIQQAYKK